MPPVRTIRSMVTLGVAIAVALVCVRLGIWQTRRLGERRAHNARLWARMADPVIGLAEVGTDTAGTRYRRVRVEGPARYDREVAWGPRMRNGSPGVHLLTPVPYRGDTMVLVDRGWAYSPDARTIDFGRWRERDTLRVQGYVEGWVHPCAPGVTGGPPPRCADSATRVFYKLDRAVAERLVGLPLAPFVVMQTSDSALRADSVPVRVETPLLDEGPHRGYAFQWFGFALISLVGGVALARRERRDG